LRDPSQYPIVNRINELVLDIDTEVFAFIKEQFGRKITPNRLLKSMVVFICVTILIVGIRSVGSSAMLVDFCYKLAIGILVAFLIIPIHEMIHGLTYYLLGARDIRFRSNFKKMQFSAQAHNFVLTAIEFYLVALAPVVLITVAGVCFGCVIGYWISVLGFLLMHTTMSSGDIALVSYCNSRSRAGQLYTYDDCDSGKVYFFGMS